MGSIWSKLYHCVRLSAHSRPRHLSLATVVDRLRPPTLQRAVSAPISVGKQPARRYSTRCTCLEEHSPRCRCASQVVLYIGCGKHFLIASLSRRREMESILYNSAH